jgi:excisionase family DNA binding protein
MAEVWISTEAASELLGISRRQVVNRIHEGKLKAKKDNGKWLVHSSLSEPSEKGLQELPQISGKFPKKDKMIAYLQSQVESRDNRIEELERRLDQKDTQIGKLQEAIEEASHRHDTVVMQMTRLLEYHQQPFWRKLFSRKALPRPVDETAMSMESKKRAEENEPLD